MRHCSISQLLYMQLKADPVIKSALQLNSQNHKYHFLCRTPRKTWQSGGDKWRFQSELFFNYKHNETQVRHCYYFDAAPLELRKPCYNFKALIGYNVAENKSPVKVKSSY